MTLVLIVDDNASVRDSLVEMLSLNGFIAVGCEGGRSAIEATRHVSFDVVVADVLMPEMDGYELLKAIKSAKREAAVLLMSGGLRSPGFDILGIGRVLGADGGLLKPFSCDELLARIDNLLRARPTGTAVLEDARCP